MAVARVPKGGLNPLHQVHNSVYGEACYRVELERIFDRVWNFVCHESEVPEPGSYMARDVAENPVLVVRDEGETIRAFHNVCRHRGCMVVDEGCDKVNHLRCPYHFWVYGLDGSLQSVPGEEAYEGTGFCREDFGLVPVRTEILYGLVFVCFNEETPDLKTWVGPELVETLRVPLSSAEYEVVHTRTLEVQGNWKLFVENSRDGYHVPFVHPFYRGASPPLEYRLYDNGHAVQHLGMAKAPHITEEMWETYMSHPLPGVQPGDGYIAIIWPDLAIHFRSNVLALDSQTMPAWNHTLLEGRVLCPKGDSEEVRAKRIATWKDWVDDRLALEEMPVMAMQQKGLMSRGARWSLIARGEEANTGRRGDDNRLRQFWQPWRKLMGLQANDFRPAMDGD